jgi:tetratricopeptide (TPR) repeat protein
MLQEAITWQEKAIQANRKNPIYREFLCKHYQHLATVLGQLKSPEREQILREAIASRKALLELSRKVPGYHSEMGSQLNDCAVLLLELGEADEARQMLEEAIGHQRKALKVEPGKPKYRLFLRNHYKNLGKALLRLEQQDRAVEALRQAVAIGEALVKEFPRDRTFLENLADDHSRLGLELRGGPQTKEREEAFRQARKRWQELAGRFPEVAVYRSRVAFTLYNLAVLFARQGGQKQARPLLEDSIPHVRAAYEAEPERYRGKLLRHYQTLVQVLLDLHDHAAAAKRAPEMVPVSGKDWKPCNQAARYLVRCVSLVAEDAKLDADRRKELTQTYTRQLWDLLAETAKRNPDHPEVQTRLALFLATCPEAKYRDAARAVELAGKAVGHDPKRGESWGILGLAQYRAGNWKEAVAMIQKARTLNGGEYVLFFLAMAHWQQGEKKLAHKLYEEALGWMKEHAPDNPLLRSYHAEAAKLMGLKKE